MTIQQTILKGIREQLFFHDYLVLPGFGGFVLKPQPAQFSAGASQLMPPGKTVTFNAQLKQNDGILVQWLLSEMSIDTSTALRHLSDFAEYCQSVLTAKRRLAMEGIGFFYLDFENNLCFEPRHDLNFLASSFGLAPVSVKALLQEEPEPVRKMNFADRVISQEEQPTKKQSFAFRKLSTIVVLATLFSSLLFLLVANTVISGQLSASLSGSDKNRTYQPIVYQPLAIESSVASPSPYIADANGIAVINLTETKALAVQAVSGLTNDHLSSGENFELVMGCFEVEKNARKLIRSLKAKRLSAHISGKNAKGMFVVSTGNFKNKDAAMKELSKIKGLYPNTWIRVKD